MIAKRLSTIVASILLLVPAVAAVDSASAWAPLEGFDWAARVNSTHILRDARPFASMVDLDDVETAYIDLEVTGLRAWPNAYTLTNGVVSVRTVANDTGVGVFWNVPAAPGTWVVRDDASPEPVTLIVLEGRGQAPVGDVGDSRCWWYFGCRTRSEPRPQPVGPEERALTDGIVEQGVYSYTPNARLEMRGKWTHNYEISAFMSGGKAVQAGTAAAWGYTRSDQYPLWAQASTMEMTRRMMAVKTNYDDGSYTIQVKGHESHWTVKEEPNGYQSPPPRDDSGEWESFRIDIDADDYSFEVDETRDASFMLEGGVKAFGVKLGVKLSTSARTEAKVNVTVKTHKTYLMHKEAARDGQGALVKVWELRE